MTDPQLGDTESRGPLVVGKAQPDSTLSLVQARRIVQRRLDRLVGGRLLSRSGINRLTRRLRVRRYAAGETILNKGVHGDFMGLVAKGQVAIHVPPEKGSSGQLDRVSPTVLLLPGGTFGEAMLLDGRPCASLLRAVTDTELYVLRRDDLLAVAKQPLSRPTQGAGLLLRGLAIVALAFALLAVAVGIYFGVSFLLGRMAQGAQTLETDVSIPVSGAVDIVDPQQGEILQQPATLQVRALLAERGFYQAELAVDGRGLGVQVNPEPEAVPWLVEWDWDAVSEGSHVLVVRAQKERGELDASLPVTVTIVPTGTLAFASNRDGPHDIYTMGTDGRDLTRLTAGLGNLRRPAWGSAGVLAFVAEPEVGSAAIRQMTFGRGGTTDLFRGWDPAWSLNGTRLAYAATVEDVSQVFTATVPGGAPSQVTKEAAYAGQPTWSPDGNRLAYVAQQEGNWDIWVVALDTGESRRLTKDPAMDWAPAWSPDGTRLAFVSNRGGSHQLYAMRSDGSDVQPLTEFSHGAEAPAWSPDGRWLAFVAYTGDGTGINAREIHLMRADGRDQIRLTYNSVDDTQPDWRRAP